MLPGHAGAKAVPSIAKQVVGPWGAWRNKQVSFSQVVSCSDSLCAAISGNIYNTSSGATTFHVENVFSHFFKTKGKNLKGKKNPAFLKVFSDNVLNGRFQCQEWFGGAKTVLSCFNTPLSNIDWLNPNYFPLIFQGFYPKTLYPSSFMSLLFEEAYLVLE